MARAGRFTQAVTNPKRRYAAFRITGEIAHFDYLLLLLVRIQLTHVSLPRNLYLPLLYLEYQVFVIWQRAVGNV